jgi:hypothetical protein
LFENADIECHYEDITVIYNLSNTRKTLEDAPGGDSWRRLLEDTPGGHSWRTLLEDTPG